MNNYKIPINKTLSSPNIYLLPLAADAKGGAVGGGKVVDYHQAMRRSASSALLFVFVSLFLIASFSLYYLSDSTNNKFLYFSTNLSTRPPLTTDYNNALVEDLLQPTRRHMPSSTPSDISSPSIDSASVLLPDWEVLVIVSPETPLANSSADIFTCHYPNNVTSPARFSGVLPSTNQTTFKCLLPRRCRRKMPFLAPILTRSPEKEPPASSPKVIFRWNFLAYESFSTEDDVVLFAKGVNNRQGINRSPNEFRCVFIVDDVSSNNNNISNVVRTAVTSSVQEVFRCDHPDLAAFGSAVVNDRFKLKISLEISEDKTVIPSVAYYTLPRRLNLATSRPKSHVCAATMVYNVGKFLKEWVMYYSRIGVDKFFLYDNDSDDDLETIVKELNEEGYNVETMLWVWPKTQEAGFSHAALYAKRSCTWLMYVDVDEFVFAPSWQLAPHPSDQMLKSLLPESHDRDGMSSQQRLVGQVSVLCLEFGPSNQRSNPEEGVTQGYNCRRKAENRHKSIVLLDAIDPSLLNAIHHFTLKGNYRTKQLKLEAAVVNHYKYQAWSEFKAKFRRRVSAYVVDWKQATNPLSKDRAPGLGFEAIEPAGWENKFCEVRDERLKKLAQRWFGTETGTGYRMAWQQ